MFAVLGHAHTVGCLKKGGETAHLKFIITKHCFPWMKLRCIERPTSYFTKKFRRVPHMINQADGPSRLCRAIGHPSGFKQVHLAAMQVCMSLMQSITVWAEGSFILEDHHRWFSFWAKSIWSFFFFCLFFSSWLVVIMQLHASQKFRVFHVNNGRFYLRRGRCCWKDI